MTPAERRADVREQFDFSRGPVDLTGFNPHADALELLPEPIVRTLRAVPLVLENGVLMLAVDAVPSEDRASGISRLTGTEVDFVVATPESIDAVIADIYGSGRRGPHAL